MLSSLPQDPKTLLNSSWQEIEPHYKDLAARTFSAQNVAGWLADWTALDERISEMYSRLHVATTVNTADKDAETKFKAFLDEIYPAVAAAEQTLREMLLASGLEPEGFAVPLKKMRVEADLYREANLPLLTEERKLAMEYAKIIGAQTVQWEGKEVTISQMRPV